MMAKILKFNIHTGAAWLIWAVLLTWAYYHPNPQFPNYAIWLTAGVTAYTGKRLLQKRKEFNGAKP
jgi:hypothetical protein